MTQPIRPVARLGLVVSAATALALVGTGSAQAGPAACDNRANNTHAKLAECVTLAGVQEHLAAFQSIADANGGNRASGTTGFDASRDYVVSKLKAAGYSPQVQDFTFRTFTETAPTTLERVSPEPAGPIETNVMSYSGSGDVTADVTALPGPDVDETPGCEASDFEGFTAGNIALISRGACAFGLKAANAEAAGAAGVVIYNNADGVLNGTLGDDFTGEIPVTSVTKAVGQELAAVEGLVLSFTAQTVREEKTTYNITAETKGGDANHVVMVGAHLDSVPEGPGINDNGSGSASILEVAEGMAKVKPVNKVRFAWWGAEEAGLVGSYHYVDSLTEEQHAQIALYLNFDMVGSPNPVNFIYDGDDSDDVGEGPGPEGSAQIEKAFESFYDSRGVPFKGTDFDGRSDYGPFIETGIPSGGLFTGAEGIKTPEEAAIFGGEAGVAYDKCYHAACDDLSNINTTALDVNSDAIAYATLQFAMNSSSITGQPGKGNFRTPGEGGHGHGNKAAA